MRDHDGDTGAGGSTIERGTFSASDGVDLAFTLALPAGPPRAALVLSHGLAEHVGRYAHVLEALAARGFAVHAHDHRGHGNSGGTRVFVERFAEYAADIQTALGRLKTRFPGVPKVLFGHSMGGLVVIDHLLRYPGEAAAAVLSGPGVEVGVKVPAWKDALGKVMSHLLPKLAIPTGIPPEHVSRDAEVVRAYASDPLVSKKATARWYVEFLATQARAFAGAPELRTPLLVVYGTEDRLVSPAGIARWAEKVGSPDKTVIPYPGLFHEVVNEPERAVVLGDILRWLEARFPAA
jgi:alpha-beta hydrolase superfamily lysophospholipase